MENILVFFFSFLLFFTLLSPFYILKKKVLLKQDSENEYLSELKALRNIEFENLQDLKIDLELKKITESEFYDLSMPIIKDLEKIDYQLKNLGVIKQEKSIEKPKINFCYHCGCKVANHLSCPSCNSPLMVS